MADQDNITNDAGIQSDKQMLIQSDLEGQQPSTSNSPKSFSKTVLILSFLLIVTFTAALALGFTLFVQNQTSAPPQPSPAATGQPVVGAAPSMTPENTLSVSPAAISSDEMVSPILVIGKNVNKHDYKGNIIPDVTPVDIIIDISSEGGSVIETDKKLANDLSEQIISSNGSKYLFTISKGGLCPWEDDGSGCRYTDEQLPAFGKNAVLRIWRDDPRGVFALNFQSLEVGGYGVDHFEITKQAPNKTFNETEIATWRKLVEKVETTSN